MDPTDVEPFTVAQSAADTDGEYVRLEGLVHPNPDAEGATDLAHERYVIDNRDEHVHPEQSERIEVLAGRYRVAFDGTEHDLAAGEEIEIPEATPHRHWNPAAEPAHVAHEHHPAMRSEEMFETFYVLAQAGRTDETGMPGPVQFAVTSEAYPDHAYTTDLPVGVQKALAAVVGPVGRLVGYEPRYSRDDLPALD